jgi:ribosomal protein S30
MKIRRNYERGYELMCQAIVFSRSDKLQTKERRKKVHRKKNDAKYKERTEETGLCKCCFGLCKCCFNRHIWFLLLWRHVMGLLLNKGTGEDVQGSSHCLTGCTIPIWATSD